MATPVSLSTKQFINKWFGLAAPVIKRGHGYFTTATDIDLIKSSIRMILGTRRGERTMNRKIGSELYRLEYEQNDFVIKSLVNKYVIQPLNEQEPRIEIVDVSVEPQDNDTYITIVFRLVDDYTRVESMTFALERQ
jgi:phage baseplate assembly protein W